MVSANGSVVGAGVCSMADFSEDGAREAALVGSPGAGICSESIGAQNDLRKAFSSGEVCGASAPMKSMPPFLWVNSGAGGISMGWLKSP